MKVDPHHLRDELTDWEVTLLDGSVLTLRAHAYGEGEEDFVFTALMVGPPMYEYELTRIPKRSVEEIAGGWISERPLAPPV